jgi:amino acid adenylation domain-containing protein
MARVESAGSAVALVQDDSRITFQELSDRADAIMGGLAAHCPCPPVVGIHLAPGIDSVATILAVMKLGGSYVPLDPDHPQARNQLIVDQIRPGVVVSDEKWTSCSSMLSGRQLMSSTPSIPTHIEHDPVLNIVFTSGSTGQPKGVRILKRSLVNRLAWMEEAYPFRHGDVALLHKPLSLVAAAVEVFQGLVAGIPTVIASRSIARDPPALWELLKRESVSHVLASPAFWSGIVEHAETTGDTLPTLRFATTSAEPIFTSLARRWLRCFPSVPFLNLYGSTECSSNAVAFDIRELRPNDSAVPVGRAIRGVQVTVRNPSLELVVPGSIGELCVSGACLAAGYLEESVSQQAFVQDGETRLLRTGDLVYERDDGHLVLVGRNDNRVNVNGYRVEFEEVERVLFSYPGVEACAVALAPHPANGLVGYIVGREWSVGALRSHLEARLPGYMVPRYWVSLAQLPRNAAGKLDRWSLPPPNTDRQELGIPLRAASSPLQKLIVQAWCDVMGFSKAGMDDDFVAYGGTSIQAARILGQLLSAMRVRIPYASFMAEATPLGLENAVVGQLGETLANDIAAAWSEKQARGDERAGSRYSAVLANAGLEPPAELPDTTDALSFGQSSLWFFQQLRPESAAYNLAYAYRLRGPLALPALGAAINDVIAANESLRSAFVEANGKPIASVAPPHSCPVELATTQISEPDIRSFIDSCAAQPFDLRSAPLIRGALGRFADDDHVLVIVVHHIVFDGWSRRILLNQIAEQYWRRVCGDWQALTGDGFSYRAFPEMQRRWMDSRPAAVSLAFWREQLRGVAAPLPLPTDYPRPGTHTNTGHKIVHELEPSISSRIDAFARERRTTPFVVLLSAFKLLLFAKQVEDLVVGVPFANRDRPEFDSTIGYFVNTVIVRTRYDESMTVAQLLETENDAVNAAISHGSYPFDRLVSDLAVPRSLAFNPLCQVIFNLLGDEWDTLSLNGIQSDVLMADNGGSQVDLSVAARRSGGGYSMTWEYCDALFSNDTVRAWQKAYEQILNELTVEPDRIVSRVLQRLRELAHARNQMEIDIARTSRIERLRHARAPTTGAAKSSPEISIRKRRVISEAALTKEEPLFGDLTMLKIEPSVRGLEPVAWAGEHAATIRAKLLACGGILFRGFGIGDGTTFEGFFRAICGQLNEYSHRVTKRTQVSDSFVYTSTDHPKTLNLALHNETSYTKKWAAQIGFYCDTPSNVGGQTPVADSRKVLAALPRDLVERFSRKQLLYMRNSGNAIELTWQETFQANDRSEVEEYCKSHEMEFEWKPDGQLRTFQRCHVLARHPSTGDPVWFNQAHLMHRSAYPPGVIERMFPGSPDDELPFNVFFADRTPIPDADIALIHYAFQSQAREFDWQRGDVMILDNMLMAHGRRPFDGSRRILVAMSGVHTAHETALAPGDLGRICNA